jgi:LuxR family maltose regulon positive regulatory protein
VEEKLQAAEAALGEGDWDDEAQNLVGLIAAARATLALTRYEVETMVVQSRRALKYLQPDSLISRASANWTLGHAHLLQKDCAAARQSFAKAISISQAANDIFTAILATIGLGDVQEAENQLFLAAETYRRVLQLAGDQPLQIISEAHLGLARVLYEWNELDAAEEQGQQGLQLARQYERVIDRFVSCEVFLARLKLAQGDVTGASALLAQADRSVRQHGFLHRVSEVMAAQVLTLLHQGNLAAADELAQAHEIPLSQARVHLARRDLSRALAVLGPLHQQAEEKGWADDRLRVVILEAIAYHALGKNDEAVQLLRAALEMAEPGGFVRSFVDEGPPMARLLREALSRGVAPEYVRRLLSAFPAAESESTISQRNVRESEWLEPLSEREVQVLQLIAEGLTNREIADKLYLSVHTVKVHARNIYGKLGVKNRTQAVARGKALGILTHT